MNIDIRHSLQRRHNEHDSVSNHQPHDCLPNRLFKRRSKRTSELRLTGLCVRNSPVTGEFPAQMASYAENVSIWWRHHVFYVHQIVIPPDGTRKWSQLRQRTFILEWRFSGWGPFMHISVTNYAIIFNGLLRVWRLPFSEPILTCCPSDLTQQTSRKFESKYKIQNIFFIPVNAL